MAIEGLRTVPEPNLNVNATDEVGAAVQALDMLGLVEDHERVTETVAADFDALTASKQPGEPYIQVSRKRVSLPGIISVLDGATYPASVREYPDGYPDTWIYHDLWTPGTNKGSLEVEDIGNLELGQRDDFPTHARLALHNPNSHQERLLHYLGKPFDEMYAKKGEETQLQAFATSKTLLEAAHEGFALTPLNVNAVAMIALTRRIKGQDMPLEWGFMRDATLPRKTVGGDSFVGYVDSNGGQLGLDGSSGNSGPFGGLGLSVGPKVLEPQAS